MDQQIRRHRPACEGTPCCVYPPRTEACVCMNQTPGHAPYHLPGRAERLLVSEPEWTGRWREISTCGNRDKTLANNSGANNAESRVSNPGSTGSHNNVAAPPGYP